MKDRKCVQEKLTSSKGLVNDRPHPVRNGLSSNTSDDIGKVRQALPQFIAVGVKNILLFVYGMTLGYPTIVIPAIQGGEGREPSDIVLNREQISWFSSINLICVPLGCIFSGAFSQPIGKRRAMQIVNIPIVISWLLFHFSTSIEYLYAGLCLSGLSGGLMEAPVLTYVAEITEPQYRGLLAASGSACVIMGVFIQFILGSFLDWRTIAAVSTVFPAVSIIALFFVPESPTWLIRQNMLTEAIKSLQWLRGWVPEHKVQDEFNSLYDQLIVKPEEEDKQNKHESKILQKILLFKKRSFLKPFALILFTFFVGHFSGKTALQTYAVQIFHTLKAPINKYHATILLGMAELIGTLLCVVLIHFTGKRPLVFLSTIGCGLCFSGTATYAYFLNIVPGFAVSNVVVNASLLVPKESIITWNNLTEIFKEEEKALVEQSNNLTSFTGDIITTIQPEFLQTFGQEEFTNYGNMSLNEDVPTTYLSFDSEFNLTDTYFALDTDAILFEDLPFNETDFDYIVHNVTEESLVQNSSETLEENEGSEDLTKKILVSIPNQKQNKYLWLPLVLLLGSAFFAHIGIRLIPWLLIGEVYPAAIRSTASGLSGGFGYVFGFLANKLFLQMLATMTMPGTFWFYSAVAIFGTIVLYFVLPETEGRSLSDIEDEFAGLEASKKEDIAKAPNDIEMKLNLPITLALPTELTHTTDEFNKDDPLSNNAHFRKGFNNKAFTDDNEQTGYSTRL